MAAACVHLAHKRTADAEDELRVAAKHLGSSNNGESRSRHPRIAVRVALEEGDLARAARSLETAADVAATPEARAETALLGALLSRAAGQPFEEAAARALDLSRALPSAELALEAHLLLANLHLEREEARAARAHAASATALRDRMAASLPEDIRARFVERRDLAELSRMEARLRELPGAPPTAVADRGAAAAIASPAEPARIVGQNKRMLKLLQTVQVLAPTQETVLILGETGSGKDMVARAVHQASGRRGPLVTVNSAALAETLLLDELFGHEKGAFTGATSRRKGYFEVADGGSLFLDEIGDISPDTQKALLRVLQHKTFERIGGTVTLRTDCRVICATNRPLRTMVDRGEFREDLYYRLQGFILQVPPLRERLDDLPLLTEALLRRIAAEGGQAVKRLSPDALVAMSRYPWPGNVRELESALRHMALFAEGETLEVADFTASLNAMRGLSELSPGGPAAGAGAQAAAQPAPAKLLYDIIRGGEPLKGVTRAMERECIVMALEESHGVIAHAAELLRMKRTRLSQLVDEYGLKGWIEEMRS